MTDNVHGNGFMVRPYRPGDELGIIRLLEKTFHYRMPLEKWEWLFKKNPYGSDILVAVNENGEIVGHQGRMAHRGVFFGQEKAIEYPVESCLLPQYRSQGFMEKCLERYPLNPQILAWSFNSWKMSQAYGKISRAVDHGDFSYLVISVPQFIKRLSHRKETTGYRLEPIGNFNAAREIDRLWDLKRSEVQVGICRDWKHLSWKIGGRKPERSRNVFILKHGRETVGYIGLGRLHNGTIDITDILAFNEHVTPSLFAAIESSCLARGAKKVNVIATDKALAAAMKSRHYEKSHKRYFNCYDKSMKITPDCFYLTFSDYWL